MEIYKKLHEAKKEIGKITKDSKNPFFKSNYLSLNGLIDAIEPVLEKNGLLFLQPIKDNKVCSIIFDIESGESVISEIELGQFTDPQKMGSAITYYRRYTLQSLLGLQAEDDDANKASQTTKQQTTKTPETPTTLSKMSDDLYGKAIKSTKLESLESALVKYDLLPKQKEGIENRITELKK